MIFLIFLAVSVTSGLQEPDKSCSRLIDLDIDVDCTYTSQGYSSYLSIRTRNSVPAVSDSTQGNSTLTPELTAYPAWLHDKEKYKTRFYISLSGADMTETDEVEVWFWDKVKKTEVTEARYRITKRPQVSEQRFSIGCYWHHGLLPPTGKVTVEVMVILHPNRKSARFYFRIPNWGKHNYVFITDGCLFDPFIYVRNWERSEEITIKKVNCSNGMTIALNRKSEVTDEETHVQYLNLTNTEMVKRPLVNYLHYYTADIRRIEVADEGDAESWKWTLILIPVVLSILALLMWRRTSGTSGRPKVRFIYDEGRLCEIYRKQTEILISFLENYCGIDAVRKNPNQDPSGSEPSPLTDLKCDITVFVPFPVAGSLSPEPTGTSCLTILLPFWSSSAISFTPPKRGDPEQLTLMQDFVLFVRRLHRKYCGVLPSFDVYEIERKLEEFNITDDGFAFCLHQPQFDPFLENCFRKSTNHPLLQEMTL